MGIKHSQYKDPYKPISIIECHKGFECGSDNKDESQRGDHVCDGLDIRLFPEATTSYHL